MSVDDRDADDTTPLPPPERQSNLDMSVDATPLPLTRLASEPPPRTPTPPPPAPDWWDASAAWLAKHGALPALGAITLLMVVIYANMFGGELVGDDLSFHMAEARRIADCLSHGDFDLWNPSANSGFASAYYYQVVPQLASAIPTAIFGEDSFLFFFQLSVFLPLVLAPAAAYRGMRLLGATPWQAVLAAAVIGLANGESRWGTGNAGTFNVGLYTQTWALAAFPLALGHSVRWVSHSKNLAAAIFWGGFVFLCHPFAGVALGVALIVGVIVQFVMRGVDRGFAWLASYFPEQPHAHDDGFSRAVIKIANRWRTPPDRGTPVWGELLRGAILAAALFLAWMPVWLPLLIDYSGFGGFPHRVNDEIGPGFKGLATWWNKGAILDHRPKEIPGLSILTFMAPIVFVCARATFLRWLWWPALFYALLLGLGPHLGTTQNDLFPAVRFLGAMQVTLAMAIGGGMIAFARVLWRAEADSLTSRITWLALTFGIAISGILFARYLWSAPPTSQPLRVFDFLTFRQVTETATLRVIGTSVIGILTLVGAPAAFLWMRSPYAIRTGLAALGAGLGVLVAIAGSSALRSRIHTLPDYEKNYRHELLAISAEFEHLPQGRKQVGTGAENHWWNLLTYVYARRPALLMMGGGGLQASPNYDFLWNSRDYTKNAYLYDAPYLVFNREHTANMPAGESILRTEHYEIRRLPNPSGLVSPIEVVGLLPAGPGGTGTPARKAAIEWLKTDAPVKDRMLAYDGSGPVGPAGDGSVLRAWRQDSPGDDADIVAEVAATTPTTFVARESWHPRWHVYIDGAPATVRRVTPDFPAVDVPPGNHTITFRFERPWWAWACWLAWPGAAALAYLILRRRGRSNLPTARVVV
ncbi:MAG: hypothetical protein H0T79_16725, partial [Deltaproteobacteria bacterium]|nr:hypothetical protein [Deltaproteobacteria bacterium]